MTTVEPAVSHQSEVIETVNARLPRWRTQEPHRVRAAGWPTRVAVVDGHEFDVAVLPTVGVTWVARGVRYWWRRVQTVTLSLIGAAVITTFDVGFGQGARETSDAALAWLIAVLAVLAVAGLVFYWRPDLYAKDPVPGTPRLPGPVRILGSLLGVVGLVATPAWLLSLVADLVPRFPVHERAAWADLADQQPDSWGDGRQGVTVAGGAADRSAGRSRVPAGHDRSATAGRRGSGRLGDRQPRGRGLLDVAQQQAPAWRARLSSRVVAASGPTLPARIDGRDVEMAVLPGVRTDWFARGGRYWRRRIGSTVWPLVLAGAFGWLDVAFIGLAAHAGSVTSFVVVIAVLFVAGAVLAVRPDAFAAHDTSRRHLVRTPVAWVVLVVGAVGRLTTPGWLLVVALRQLPRFPLPERLAWLALLDQLASPPQDHRTAARRR